MLDVKEKVYGWGRGCGTLPLSRFPRVRIIILPDVCARARSAVLSGHEANGISYGVKDGNIILIIPKGPPMIWLKCMVGPTPRTSDFIVGSASGLG